MHPLRLASFYLYEVSAVYEEIAVAISGVPILGEYLSMPFFWVVNFLNWVAYYLNEADDWISGLDFELVIDNIERWLMTLMGATTWDLLIFGDNLFAFSLHRMGLPSHEALMASSDLSDYLRWKMTTLWGFLEDLFEDPFGGLMTILGAEEWEVIEFYGHFLAWLLWKAGMTITEAMLFESDLSGWLIYRLTEIFPWLEILLTDPPGWVMLILGAEEWELVEFYGHFFAWVLWRLGIDLTEALFFEEDPVGWIWLNLREAVDLYIDIEIEWLISTFRRVIVLIWETRI